MIAPATTPTIIVDGVSLAEAPLRFAPELAEAYIAANRFRALKAEAFLRRIAKELRGDSRPLANRKSKASGYGIDIERLQTDPSYLCAVDDEADDVLIQTDIQDLDQIVRKAEVKLKDDIRARQYYAKGFDPPRRSDSPIVWLSNNILSKFTSLNFRESEVSIGKLKLVDVHLVRGQMPEYQLESADGAPSKERLCTYTYDQLVAAGKIDDDTPEHDTVSLVITKIADDLKEAGRKDAPPDRKTVRKHIRTHREKIRRRKEGK